MRPLLALAAMGLGIYFILSDKHDVPVWLPWGLIFIAPIIIHSDVIRLIPGVPGT